MALDRAAPETGRQWLATRVRQYLKRYGTDRDSRLFRGERGRALAGVMYTRRWNRARAAALTEDQYASPLARRPNDLRHAAVSTWLNSGVAPTQVAEWAAGLRTWEPARELHRGNGRPAEGWVID
jgi:hypothetical protein